MPHMIHDNMRRQGSDVTLIDENAALLGKPAAQDDDIDACKRAALSEPAPLPMGQLLALCATRLSDPISFTHIFPYVNEMMVFLKVTDDPAKVGYYSGVVESIFAVAQLASTYQWADLSDRIGRKPVLLAGTLGGGLAGLLFGWSKTLPALLFARCLAGVFSGTLTVGNTVLGDITNASNQAVAFPIYGLVWPLGAIIGPLLGGSFANPATQYPTLFTSDFWKEYPYFLPGAIAALISVAAVIVGQLTLKETLPPKAIALPTATRNNSTYGATDDVAVVEICAHEKKDASARELLANGLIRSLCLTGFALTFTATSFEVVFILFCFSPVASGGLAFPAAHIGYGLAIAGAVATLLQIIAMPWLLRNIDVGRLFKLTLAAWPAAFAILPFLHYLAEWADTPDDSGSFSAGTMVLLWSGIALSLGLSRIGCMAYSPHMILVKDAAPSPSALGRTNGVAQVFHTSARAIAPTIVSAFFAVSSVQAGFLRYMWAAAMVIICIVSCKGAGSIQTQRRRAGMLA